MLLEPQLQKAKSHACPYIPQLDFILLSSCTDLAIDVPDFLDLSRMRATGLQAGEEELPDLMPPIVLPEDTRGTEQVHCMPRVVKWKC